MRRAQARYRNEGCGQQPAATAAVIEDKTYTVTPASVTVKGRRHRWRCHGDEGHGAGRDSGRVVSPAKLTGMLKLKNGSTNQTVRLVTVKINYLDAQGQPIRLEETRAEPILKFSTYGSDRLDPRTGDDPVPGRGFPPEAGGDVDGERLS